MFSKNNNVIFHIRLSVPLHPGTNAKLGGVNLVQNPPAEQTIRTLHFQSLGEDFARQLLWESALWLYHYHFSKCVPWRQSLDINDGVLDSFADNGRQAPWGGARYTG